MSAPDLDPQVGATPLGTLDHLRRALKHAEAIGRCYLAMIASDLELRSNRVLRRIIWELTLTTLLITGIIILSLGFVELLSYVIDLPGGGRMVVGLALIVLTAGAMLVRSLIGRK